MDTASNLFAVSFAAYGHLNSTISFSFIIPSKIFLQLYYNTYLLIIILLDNLEWMPNMEYIYQLSVHIFHVKSKHIFEFFFASFSIYLPYCTDLINRRIKTLIINCISFKTYLLEKDWYNIEYSIFATSIMTHFAYTTKITSCKCLFTHTRFPSKRFRDGSLMYGYLWKVSHVNATVPCPCCSRTSPHGSKFRHGIVALSNVLSIMILFTHTRHGRTHGTVN